MPQNKWGIKEKEIEDWICEYPYHAFWPGFEIIGRQIDLPHGILDILAYDNKIYLLEIKARKIQEKDVGQLLRYTHDVKEALELIGLLEAPQFNIPNPSYFPREFPHAFKSIRHQWLHVEYWNRIGLGEEAEQVWHICPIFIGLCPDDKTLAAIAGAHIDCYTWSYDQTSGLEIDFMNLPHVSFEPIIDYPPWLIDIFNRTIKTSMNEIESVEEPIHFPHIMEN